MRILANENFPEEAVAALRERSHDVAWIRTDAPGCSDREVIERARASARLIITFDKDFGELAFRSKLPASCGIVLFRIAAPSAAHVARAAVAVLESRADWAGSFAVVEEHRVRVRPLPTSTGAAEGPPTGV
jgi:predicted nuclease of predicted toxin-antitoxin system